MKKYTKEQLRTDLNQLGYSANILGRMKKELYVDDYPEEYEGPLCEGFKKTIKNQIVDSEKRIEEYKETILNNYFGDNK